MLVVSNSQSGCFLQDYTHYWLSGSQMSAVGVMSVEPLPEQEKTAVLEVLTLIFHASAGLMI